MRPRGLFWWLLLVVSLTALAFVIGWLLIDPEPNARRQDINKISWAGLIVSVIGIVVTYNRRR